MKEWKFEEATKDDFEEAGKETNRNYYISFNHCWIDVTEKTFLEVIHRFTIYGGGKNVMCSLEYYETIGKNTITEIQHFKDEGSNEIGAIYVSREVKE